MSPCIYTYRLAGNLCFDPTSLQKVCCGIGGDYNFGDPEVAVCENPDERLSWDGIHLTQGAYELMATWLIPVPNFPPFQASFACFLRFEMSSHDEADSWNIDVINDHEDSQPATPTAELPRVVAAQAQAQAPIISSCNDKIRPVLDVIDRLRLLMVMKEGILLGKTGYFPHERSFKIDLKCQD
ncbi:hypothetical protein F3Y22_tig00111053pilonHSYRG00054 [Hibiscus syriacus]|uniref:GDSL esterase/lipase n=1 Tax=Hibiscus syriacus TaxID=106335 RepID=A0A6A2Z595_HIBSY|nr:hypothetical protein F3Y22_tig00111053pilonHSYRG00054 [Hibiscus syriacus]